MLQKFLRFFSVGFVALLVIGISSCASTDREKDEAKAAKVNAPVEVSDEVSLKSDRAQFDEARKEIPDDIKKQNDEIALVMGMMTKGGGDEDPSKIRDRFSKALRDRREKHDKILWKKREDFTKNERKERDAFMHDLQKSRDEFSKRKVKSDERKEFFDKQEEARKEFFANQSDKRKEFESDATEDRKTFEDYAREKQNSFNEEIRSYTAAYYERQKALALKKRTEEKAKDKARERNSGRANADGSVPSDLQNMAFPGAGGSELDEFRSIPKTPATPLGSGSDGQ